jgi:hypothetical protein
MQLLKPNPSARFESGEKIPVIAAARFAQDPTSCSHPRNKLENYWRAADQSRDATERFGHIKAAAG